MLLCVTPVHISLTCGSNGTFLEKVNADEPFFIVLQISFVSASDFSNCLSSCPFDTRHNHFVSFPYVQFFVSFKLGIAKSRNSRSSQLPRCPSPPLQCTFLNRILGLPAAAHSDSSQLLWTSSFKYTDPKHKQNYLCPLDFTQRFHLTTVSGAFLLAWTRGQR